MPRGLEVRWSVTAYPGSRALQESAPTPLRLETPSPKGGWLLTLTLPDLAVSGADLLPSGVRVDDGDAPAVGVQRELAAALRRPSAGLRVDAPVGDEDVRVGVTSVLVGVDGVRAGVAVGRDVP